MMEIKLIHRKVCGRFLNFPAPGSHLESILWSIDNHGPEVHWHNFKHSVMSSNFNSRLCWIHDGVEIDVLYLENWLPHSHIDFWLRRGNGGQIFKFKNIAFAIEAIVSKPRVRCFNARTFFLRPNFCWHHYFRQERCEACGFLLFDFWFKSCYLIRIDFIVFLLTCSLIPQVLESDYLILSSLIKFSAIICWLIKSKLVQWLPACFLLRFFFGVKQDATCGDGQDANDGPSLSSHDLSRRF